VQQGPGAQTAEAAAGAQQQAGWSSFGQPAAQAQDSAGNFSMAFPHGLWNAQGFANGVSGTHQMW
jgi:hypothetical protein